MKNTIIRATLAIVGLSILLLVPILGCTSNNDGFLGDVPFEPGPGPSNTAPVANAGTDRNVTVGDTVQLNGSASHDPDGDVLNYQWSFESCPSHCPTLAGPQTATPSFVAEREGTYVVSLTVSDGLFSSVTDTVSVTASPVVPSRPDLLHMQWQYGIFGDSIGHDGMLVSDLDGDGTPEIIVSASGSFWYILRYAAGGSYEQIWRSGIYQSSYFYGTPLSRLLTADLTGDGHDDIVVGRSDGVIEIYDGPTRVKVQSITVAAPLITLAVADLDQDGTRELVMSDGTGVSVYSAETGGLLWSIPSGGGSSMAVGNVDADAGLEIVTTTSGGEGYVIDGATHTVEWEYVDSFGAQVALGDTDSDGMKEIVGASGWSKITVFDADRKTPAWEIPTSQDIGVLLVADAETDGVPEIIYGDGQWGSIHAINAQTHAEKWSVANPEHGVSGITMGDVDSDGTKEILWGAGGTSSGPDYLSVADPTTETIEWQNMDLDGPLSAVTVGDVDDDGRDEIIMVSFSSDSGYAEGIISIFDAQTHALEYQEKLGITDWMGVRSVKIGDVDDDGHTEFVVTTGNLYDGVIRVYDGVSRALKRESAYYNGNYFSALAIGDVDGDGKTEIVAGQGMETSGASGVYLIVFNGNTLAEKWRSVDLGNSWGGVYDIKLADLNGDGHTEIIASLLDSRLIVYDGVTHDQKLLLAYPACALEVADIDNDGTPEILAGRDDDGNIDVFDGSTFDLKGTVPTFDSTAINAVRLADVDGDGTPDWLVTHSNELVILDGQDQGLKWRSGDLSGNAGLYNHMEIKDVDGDGKPDIFFGSDIALYHFE
jgi:hypothetical protein